MEEHIAKLYQDAPPFCEGEIVQGEAYAKALRRQVKFHSLLVKTFGPAVVPLLEEYTEALYEEMECAAGHYFREGYRAAKKET